MQDRPHYDVVVVGAGIVGLAHAYHCLRRGLRVAVVEQSDRIVGASVQNFGHACVTAQSGAALKYARSGRQHWLDVSHSAGFWSAEAGTYCIARHDDELAVMQAFASTRDPQQVVLLGREEFLARVPVRDTCAAGGMYLPDDVQVDPRTAAPSIANWLESLGVEFFWRTAASGFGEGIVHTSRGTLTAHTTFVTVNYDVDRLFPHLAERNGLVRCRLHMMRVQLELPFPLPAPLFTGWSLLRYSGFNTLPSARAVADRLRSTYPSYAAVDLHQMYSPQPDGTLLVGDTHFRDVSASPFQTEQGFDILLQECRTLFGTTAITIIERWQGVYCSAARTEFLVDEPLPRTYVVTVTAGIGMTTSFGLALDSIERAFAATDHLSTLTANGPKGRYPS